MKIPEEKPNLPWGDDISEPKMEPHCRILLLNVNGISHRENYAKIFELGEQSIDYDIDILCLVEHKLNMQNKDVYKSCDNIAKRYHNQTKLLTSSATPIECNAKYQPGGTATIVNDPYMGRICKYTSDDRLGRWNTVTLKGKAEKQVTFITAYQVNDDTVYRADDRSTWKQQYNIMRMEGNRDPNPRQQFWKDLETTIKEYIGKKHEVLLCLDANDPHAKQLAPIMSRLKMQDLHTHLHGTEGEPETQQTGSARIDFMYGTKGIIEATRKAGIGAYDDMC
jgi:exonuclease III